MDCAPVHAGTFVGRVVGKNDQLWIQNDDGSEVIGVVGLKGVEGFGVTLTAAEGSWTAKGVGGSKWHGPDSWSVVDTSGTEVATLSKDGTINAAGGSVRFEARRMGSPKYSIEGLYSADRRTISKLAAGLTKKHFECEVTPALVARPDGPIVLCLAAWRTYRAILDKIQSD